MLVRLVVGLVITAAGLAVAGRRAWWLARLVATGAPATGRFENLPRRLATQVTEVIGQRKLLKWTTPGLAHAFTFWAFIVLLLTIIEAYGAIFDRDFAIPGIGRTRWLGFLEDLFAVAVLVALVVFTAIRTRQDPKRLGRRSRFFRSHTGAAWLVLLMIFLVIATLLVYRGAQIDTGHFPYGADGWWPFASKVVAAALAPLGTGTNAVLETAFILAQIAVVVAFLVVVLYSKHLHIFLAPINVGLSRRPNALGALLPMESGGKPIDFADPPEDASFGRGKIEDFTWKGNLDFLTCTECGRCQSVCPAWNTGKPLSPKLLITDLRDDLFAEAPRLLARHGGEGPDGAGAAGGAEPISPLVGEESVIHPDVIWSCVTCGACVEECPVDIEHVDHILDLRRHEVLVESEFPTELGQLFRGLENKGNPWSMNASARLDWTKGLSFEVPVVGVDVDDIGQVDYLFWVGCAGAFDERAKKTTRAFAELLHLAGVSFAILGEQETCNGDPARRSGNEFVYQTLAQQNVALLKELGVTKVVATCPHCFNTIGNEYRQLGLELEMVHHTQLLDQLLREGRLKPAATTSDTPALPVTYHDPCYLGRHNDIYEPPRDLLAAVPGLELREMPRTRKRSFCCGAGGARMWMEERIGTRINHNRTEEAVATGADRIATACPYCKVMLGDGLAECQSAGTAREAVEVADVAQLLLDAVRPAGGDAAAGG